LFSVQGDAFWAGRESDSACVILDSQGTDVNIERTPATVDHVVTVDCAWTLAMGRSSVSVQPGTAAPSVRPD